MSATSQLPDLRTATFEPPAPVLFERADVQKQIADLNAEQDTFKGFAEDYLAAASARGISALIQAGNTLLPTPTTANETKTSEFERDVKALVRSGETDVKVIVYPNFQAGRKQLAPLAGVLPSDVGQITIKGASGKSKDIEALLNPGDTVLVPGSGAITVTGYNVLVKHRKWFPPSYAPFIANRKAVFLTGAEKRWRALGKAPYKRSTVDIGIEQPTSLPTNHVTFKNSYYFMTAANPFIIGALVNIIWSNEILAQGIRDQGHFSCEVEPSIQDYIFKKTQGHLEKFRRKTYLDNERQSRKRTANADPNQAFFRESLNAGLSATGAATQNPITITPQVPSSFQEAPPAKRTRTAREEARVEEISPEVPVVEMIATDDITPQIFADSIGIQKAGIERGVTYVQALLGISVNVLELSENIINLGCMYLANMRQNGLPFSTSWDPPSGTDLAAVRPMPVWPTKTFGEFNTQGGTIQLAKTFGGYALTEASIQWDEKMLLLSTLMRERIFSIVGDPLTPLEIKNYLSGYIVKFQRLENGVRTLVNYFINTYNGAGRSLTPSQVFWYITPAMNQTILDLLHAYAVLCTGPSPQGELVHTAGDIAYSLVTLARSVRSTLVTNTAEYNAQEGVTPLTLPVEIGDQALGAFDSVLTSKENFGGGDVTNWTQLINDEDVTTSLDALLAIPIGTPPVDQYPEPQTSISTTASTAQTDTIVRKLISELRAQISTEGTGAQENVTAEAEQEALAQQITDATQNAPGTGPVVDVVEEPVPAET